MKYFLCDFFSNQTVKVLLTGVAGFSGQHLTFYLETLSDFNLTSVDRSEVASVHGKRVVRSQIDGDTDWRGALIDKDLIIHTAARARAGWRQIRIHT